MLKEKMCFQLFDAFALKSAHWAVSFTRLNIEGLGRGRLNWAYLKFHFILKFEITLRNTKIGVIFFNLVENFCTRGHEVKDTYDYESIKPYFSFLEFKIPLKFEICHKIFYFDCYCLRIYRLLWQKHRTVVQTKLG